MGDLNASGWAIREAKQFGGEGEGSSRGRGDPPGLRPSHSSSASMRDRRDEGGSPGFLLFQLLFRNSSQWSDFLKQPPGQET